MIPREHERLGEMELGLDPDLIARFLAREQVTAQLPEMEHEDGDDGGCSGASSGSGSHLIDFGSDANDKAECHSVDDAKDIREKAEALRAYLKKAREAEGQVADIRLRDERNSGDLRCGMAEREECETVVRPAKQPHDASVSLPDSGIKKHESAHFHQIASASTAKARPERLRWPLIAVGIALGMFAAMSLWIALG
jgi:hypothetical protein